MSPANKALAEFIGQTHFEILPAEVIHQVKRALLDTTGCILAGLATPVGQRVVALSRQFPQTDGATVPAIGHGVMPVMAAMSNGFLANALDADDGHRMSRLHNGGVLFPAALAAAQQKASDGRQFITAAVVGYEIGLRAGMAMNNTGEIYFGSAHGGAYSAAAAVGFLMNLAPQDIINAVGIAEVQAPTCQLMGWIEARQVPMIKEGMGWAASTGYTAALMAAHGITGTLTLYDRHPCAAEVDQLGSDFQILKTYFKAFPACRWTHGPIENLLKILESHPLQADDIAKIRVKAPDKASLLDTARPASPEDAQYSIPFVLGAAVVDGRVDPPQMSVARLNDPEILAVAERVEIVMDPVLQEAYPERVLTVVEIETRAGEVFSQSNELITGDWDNPMSDQALIDKFKAYATPSLGAAKTDVLLNQILELEQVSDMNHLLRPLAAVE